MAETKTSAPLVVFGEDWGAHPSSTQHFMKRICKERPVIWVNSIGMRRPQFTAYDMGRIFKKLGAWIKGRNHVNPGPCDTACIQSPCVIQPMALPFPGSKIASWINGMMLSHQIKKRLKAQGLSKPVLWLSLPTAVDVVGKCGETGVIYYAGDDFSALAGVDHAPVTEMEERLAQKADAILAASQTLAKKFPRDKCFIIPHGVDYDLFATPQDQPEECKTDKPIAGFYGSIDEWMDQDLVVDLAKRMGDWQFQLVGPVKCDITKLENQPNITLLGPRAHDALPGYVQNWTCALLPFSVNDQIKACNPLKLREYLASGTPVISTSYPAAKDYDDVLFLADDPEGFEIIMQKVTTPSPKLKQAQQKRVQSESWDARIRSIMVLIEVLQNDKLSQNDMNMQQTESNI